MNFNSASFALFAVVIAVLYVLTHRRRTPRAQNLMLLAASYWFYGSWDHRFLLLILFSTGIDYCVGLGIRSRRPTRGNWMLMVGSLIFASLVLAAPIDWAAVRAALWPASAFDSGWADPVTWNGLFLKNGDCKTRCRGRWS